MTNTKKKGAGQAKKKDSSVPQVDRTTRVYEINMLCSEASSIMAEYGMHCSGCSVGGMETLEEGCELHGFDEDTIAALVIDLNDAIAEQPPRPLELTLTLEAARAIKDVAEKEGQKNLGLAVITDETGGFCMEFRNKPEDDDLTFCHKKEPDVQLFASPETLWRIGGATIDFREGRFKLDLADDCGGCGEGCDCKDKK